MLYTNFCCGLLVLSETGFNLAILMVRKSGYNITEKQHCQCFQGLVVRSNLRFSTYCVCICTEIIFKNVNWVVRDQRMVYKIKFALRFIIFYVIKINNQSKIKILLPSCLLIYLTRMYGVNLFCLVFINCWQCIFDERSCVYFSMIALTFHFNFIHFTQSKLLSIFL